MGGGQLAYRLQQAAVSNKHALNVSDVPDGVSLTAYMRRQISTYGGANAAEATAELISLYTSSTYKPGRIAKPLEDILESVLKKPRTIGKARAQESAGDFVSISIPPPPEGYELISIDGPDIRFRAPNGEVVTYVDLVESGFYDATNEDEE